MSLLKAVPAAAVPEAAGASHGSAAQRARPSAAPNNASEAVRVSPEVSRSPCEALTFEASMCDLSAPRSSPTRSSPPRPAAAKAAGAATSSETEAAEARQDAYPMSSPSMAASSGVSPVDSAPEVIFFQTALLEQRG